MLNLFNFFKKDTWKSPVAIIPKIQGRKIIDMIGKMPVHSHLRWTNRPIDSINMIVIHQSATTATYEQVARAHSTPGPQNHLSINGAPGIAYHLGIDKDGSILQFNHFTNITWHCKRFNLKSIGINVRGDFSGNGWKGKEEPTQAQLDSLQWLISYLYTTTFKNLNVKDSLKMHCENDPINRPADPGFVIHKLITEYRNNH